MYICENLPCVLDFFKITIYNADDMRLDDDANLNFTESEYFNAVLRYGIGGRTMENKIGVFVGFSDVGNVSEKIRELARHGFNCCQISCWNPELYTKENAEMIVSSADEAGVEITALWAGWCLPARWNFFEGPKTLGLIPEEYRAVRLGELKKGSDFAEMLGVTDMITHVGFLPEDPNSQLFADVVETLKDLCGYMKKKGQYFLFEAGQETPVTLLRTIETVGTGNLGVNLDTANLILYGKASTVDALDVIGKYVRNTHCKDGLYPTNGSELGIEVPLGEGKANFPMIVKRLHELDYKGPFIIEREITGEEQMNDIIRARDLLQSLLSAE